jgi:hypothetical protein
MAALHRPNPVVALFAPQVMDPGTLYSVPGSMTVFSYWRGLVFLTYLVDTSQLPDQIFSKF